jgi:hypothetical protein
MPDRGQQREVLIQIIRSELEHEGIAGAISARTGMTVADALLRISTVRAALAVREEPRADSLSDFPVEALEALRELVMPLEELPNSDRLLRLIEKALEVKRRRL